jgi:protein TonB
MFKAVLEENLPPRFIGRAAVAAFCLHGAALVMMLGASARHVEAPRESRPIKLLYAPFVPPLPAAAVPMGLADGPAAKKPERTVKKNTIIETAKPVPARPPDLPGPSNSETRTEAAATGAPSGTQPGGSQSGEGTANVPAQPPTSAVLPFGEGMTHPVLLSKRDPVYTSEAIAAHEEGTMLLKCVITQEGTLERCRIIKGLPHMNSAVLSALSTWKYAPVTFQGHPVSIEYVIQVKLVAP